MMLISISAKPGFLPSAAWNCLSSRAITRHSLFATAEALRGIWPIEAISPKISPLLMVAIGSTVRENADFALQEQVDPMGHEQQGHAFPVFGKNGRALRDGLRPARGLEEIQRDRRIVKGKTPGTAGARRIQFFSSRRSAASRRALRASVPKAGRNAIMPAAPGAGRAK